MEQGKTGQLAVALGRRKVAKRSSPTETVGSHQNPDPAQQLKTRQPPPFVGETLDAQEESGALYKRSSVLWTAAAYATIKRERGPLTQRSSRTHNKKVRKLSKEKPPFVLLAFRCLRTASSKAIWMDGRKSKFAIVSDGKQLEK
jgi:hypothetical protein